MVKIRSSPYGALHTRSTPQVIPLPPDLPLLAWTSAVAFVQVVIAALGANLQVGLPALAGNRDAMPELTGWAGRAQRAHLNMLENLPLFIALILVAHIAGKVNAT